VSAGFVLFRLGPRTFATPLDDVREIVRLTALERLPGMTPPLAGVIVLRGTPLPVLDVRAGLGDERGDVLVIEIDAETVGVAVDAVIAVLHPDELPATDAPAPATLPSYVVGVRSHGGSPVLLVDLNRLIDVSAEGRLEDAAV
jgi:chemotaxis signal transduction protein